MQTPRVEWFVSKGQRLPLVSRPRRRQAHGFHRCVRRRRVLRLPLGNPTSPRAAAGGRAAPCTGLRGGSCLGGGSCLARPVADASRRSSQPPNPEPQFSILGSLGTAWQRAALSQSLRTPSRLPVFRSSAFAFKAGPLTYPPAPSPPAVHGAPCHRGFFRRTLLKPQRKENPTLWY